MNYGRPNRVTGIFTCQVGFEQSNPLLVTTSSVQKTEYWHQQNKPERTAEFQAVRSGFLLLGLVFTKFLKVFYQFLRSKVVVDY